MTLRGRPTSRSSSPAETARSYRSTKGCPLSRRSGAATSCFGASTVTGLKREPDQADLYPITVIRQQELRKLALRNLQVTDTPFDAAAIGTRSRMTTLQQGSGLLRIGRYTCFTRKPSFSQ